MSDQRQEETKKRKKKREMHRINEMQMAQNKQKRQKAGRISSGKKRKGLLRLWKWIQWVDGATFVFDCLQLYTVSCL